MLSTAIAIVIPIVQYSTQMIGIEILRTLGSVVARLVEQFATSGRLKRKIEDPQVIGNTKPIPAALKSGAPPFESCAALSISFSAKIR